MIIAYVHKCGLKISMSAENDEIVGNHAFNVSNRWFLNNNASFITDTKLLKHWQ